MTNNHGGARPILNRTLEDWMRPRKHGGRAYKGVKRTKAGTYEAYASLSGRTIYLGTRKSPLEAADLVRAFILEHRVVVPTPPVNPSP